MKLFDKIKNARKDYIRNKEIVYKIKFIIDNLDGIENGNSVNFNTLNFSNSWVNSIHCASEFYSVSYHGVDLLTIHNSNPTISDVLNVNLELRNKYFNLIDDSYIKILEKLEKDLDRKKNILTNS